MPLRLNTSLTVGIYLNVSLFGLKHTVRLRMGLFCPVLLLLSNHACCKSGN